MIVFSRPGALAIAALASLGVAMSFYAPQAHAASQREPEPFAATGIRAAVLVPRISIEGDFDGKTMHVTEGEVFQAPKIDPATGLGLSIARRGEQYSLELNYQYTRHDATLPSGATTEATLQSYNIEFKYYFRADKRLQPFILVGLVPYARLIVAKGSAGISGGVGSADYRSQLAGLNLGLGAEWFATKRISIGGAVFYRRIMFEDAIGFRNEVIPVKYAGHGFNGVASVSYCYGDF